MTTQVFANPLAQFQWQNRILFIYGASLDVKDFRDQLADTSYRVKGLQERDLIGIQIIDSPHPTLGFFGDPAFKITNGAEFYTPEAIENIKALFSINNRDFFMALVGKDGEIKKIWDRRIDMRSVFIAIDKMPMRQREMESR